MTEPGRQIGRTYRRLALGLFSALALGGLAVANHPGRIPSAGAAAPAPRRHLAAAPGHRSAGERWHDGFDRARVISPPPGIDPQFVVFHSAELDPQFVVDRSPEIDPGIIVDRSATQALGIVAGNLPDALAVPVRPRARRPGR